VSQQRSRHWHDQWHLSLTECTFQPSHKCVVCQILFCSGGCVVSHHTLTHWPDVNSARSHTDRPWIVERRGQQLGPFSTVELALAAKNGLLGEDDLIWKSGLPNWVRAGEVDGLLPSQEQAAQVGSYGAASTGREQTNLVHCYSAAFSARKAAPIEPRTVQAQPAPRPQMSVVVRHDLSSQTYRDQTYRDLGRHEPRLADNTAGRQTDAEAMARLPAVLPAQSVGVTSSSLVDASKSHTFADRIAREIILMLDRYDIKTIDDLASNDRLRQLAGFTFDALPTTVRLPLSGIVGRAWVEAHIFDALLRLRAAVLRPEYQSLDLRQIALAQVPAIALALDTAIAQTTNSMGSIVSSNWNAVSGAIKGLQSQIAGQPPLTALSSAK